MKDQISITRSQLHQKWKERLDGPNLREEVIRYKDTDYFWKEDPNLDPETIIYERVVKDSEDQEGALSWGYVAIHPGRVDDQYFCTRGHFSSNPHAEEYVLCMEGDGLIMFLDKEGNCWCEMLEEGSLHHVDPGLAFRLINLSDQIMQVVYCKPTTSTEDEELWQNHPYPCHVYEDNGEMAIYVEIDENHQKDEKEAEDELFAQLKA